MLSGFLTITNTSTSAGSAGKISYVAVGILSGTTQIASNAAPTITSGYQIATLTVNPSSTSSQYALWFSTFVDVSSNNHNVTAVVWRTVGGVNTIVGVQSVNVTNAARPQALSITLIDAPATTSAVTYSIRVGMDASGTSYVNQYSNGNSVGGTATSDFIVQEIL